MIMLDAETIAGMTTGELEKLYLDLMDEMNAEIRQMKFSEKYRLMNIASSVILDEIEQRNAAGK